MTLNNFKEVLEQPFPFVLCFRSAWCSACAAQFQILQELEEKYDSFDLYVVDADHEPELNTLFGIRQLPAIVAMDHGRVLEHHSGFMSCEKLETLFNKL